MKKIARKIALRLFKWLGLPGGYYLNGKYLLIPQGGHVFPADKIGNVKIPKDITLHEAFFNAWNEIVIEEGVILGHEVMFLTGKHEVTKCEVKRTVVIGNGICVKRGAWIGSRVIILEGVIVGEGAVVGAGSVVTKSIPDHQFWAGNPAKYIKRIE